MKNKLIRVQRKQKKNKPKNQNVRRKQMVNAFRLTKVGPRRNVMAVAAADMFRRICRDPFDQSAYGARVPDSYSLPTLTYHLRATYQCVSNSGGNFECAVGANPCIAFGLGAGTIQGAGTAYANNPNFYYLMSPSQIIPFASAYRVVGWGVRLIAKDTPYAEKGRVYSSVVPNTGTQPTFNTLNNTQAFNVPLAGQYLFGYNLGSSWPSQIQNLSNVQTFSLQDVLMTGSLTMSVSPSHGDQYRFRGVMEDSIELWNTNEHVFQNGIFNSTGNVSSGGALDTTSCAGTNTVLLYVTGMPASSNEFDLDVVYHIECVPNVSWNTTTGFTPSGADASVGTTQQTETILSSMKRHTDRFFSGASSILSEGSTRGIQAITSPLGRRVLRGGLDMYLNSRAGNRLR